MSTSGWCTIQGCPDQQYDVYFKFPRDEVLCEEWLKVVKSPKSKKPILLRPSSRVCSLHFSDADYDKKVEPEGGLTLESLKPTAIPSIFPWTESWPLNKKKKKVEGGADDKDSSESQKKADAKKVEQTFVCPTCDYTTKRVAHWESHRRCHEEQHRYSCDQCNFSAEKLEKLDIHLSRDHVSSATELGLSAGRPQMRTRSRSSTGAAEAKSVHQEALAKKGYQQKSGNGGSRAAQDLLDSDDSSADDRRSEPTGGTRSTSSSDVGNTKYTSSKKLSKSPGSQVDDTIKSGTSVKSGNLDLSFAIKREVDETPIVLDSSSSDLEKADEVIGTVVKKEVVEASSKGTKKVRKIIWVVSGTADN